MREKAIWEHNALGLCKCSGCSISGDERSVRGGDWQLRTGCNPFVVGLEPQSELFIENPQVAIATAHDRFRHDRLHLLRHDTDIDFVIAVINEAIEANAVVETADEHDVVFEPHVRAAPATTTTATTTTSAATVPTPAADTVPTPAADTLPTSAAAVPTSTTA